MAKWQRGRAIGPMLAAAAIGWSAVGYANPQAAQGPPEANNKVESNEKDDEIRRLIDQADDYQERGDVVEAISLRTKVLEMLEKELAQNHSLISRNLTSLGSLYVKQGAYSKTKPLFLRALLITERTLGPDHPETAVRLNDLAYLYAKQGDYEKAEPLYLRAIAIKERALGPDHPDTATSVNNLGSLYDIQGSHAKAESLHLHALAIREKALGLDHPDTATSINNLGSVYVRQGAYSKARPLFLRAVVITEKTLGPDHPETAASLNNLAYLYAKQGAYAKAEPLYLRALAITEKALGPDHPDTAIALNNLGRLVKAEVLYKRALEIMEKAMGPDHPDTGTILNNLGSLYVTQGAYTKAEPLYLRALLINEEAFGAYHHSTAISISNLAHLYGSQGSYMEARNLFLRALAINEVTLGPDHPVTALSLNNLAFIHQSQSSFSEAEQLYLRALAINEKALGPDHPNTATNLNNLALIYSAQGEYIKAEPLYLRALAISEKALGLDHPDTATSLNNLALHYTDQGAYAKARPFYLRALAISEKALGLDHPDTAITLNNLALLNQGQDKFSNAEPYWRRKIRTSTLILQRELPLLPGSRRADQQRVLGRSSEALYGMATRSEYGPSLALFSRLNRHGLLQETEQRQALLTRGPGSQKQLTEQITGLTTRLAAVNLTPPQRQALQQEKAELEQQLYRLLPALQPRVVEVDQVTRALPADGVLVEFQRYQPFDGKQPPKQRWGPARYLALILQPNGSSAAVDLGEAAAIDTAVAAAISASAQAQSDADQLLAGVSKLVLAPLQSRLASSRQWFLSPDGELNRIPFAALPSPVAPGKTVGSSVNLRLLTTGRDLLRFQNPAPKGQAPLVMANPAFDPQGAQVASGPVQVKEQLRDQQRSAAVGSKGWTALPATAMEGQQIGALLRTKPLTGSEATVLRLQRSPSPRVVYIATHGFFAPDQVTTPTDPLVAVMERSQQVAGFSGEDPMLRSGLVLAGANQPEADRGDDGYLTAAEATALQLEGTELVVLSACSTGQGDVRTGEGVYGLQRALTVAGARSTLLSLWKVDDKATAAFMTAFYTRLKGGAGRTEALAATQAEFRNHPNTAWRQPYYWGAWQLVGDWGPIPGL
ncbi:tetratricopeptide repeat protein [Microcystis elabens FACHB-917]|nr:tetratricopeptide repeat protein [Microcystis elabens FACHB-917]